MDFLEGSELERFLLGMKSLQTGDFLEGRVIKLFNSGEALIDFGRFRAKATVQIPLAEGEHLRVIVAETGDKIRFQIQGPEKNIAADSQLRLEFIEKAQWIDLSENREFIRQITEQLNPGQNQSNPTSIPAPAQTAASLSGIGLSADTILHTQNYQTMLLALSDIKNIVNPIEIRGGAHAVATELKNLIQNSGFFLESKLLSAVMAQQGPESTPFTEQQIDWPTLVRHLQDLGQNDLKQQLNVLIRQLKNNEPSEQMARGEGSRLSSARTELESFLETMINQHRQILEETQLKQENQAIFSFHLPFEESKISGKLKLYIKKGKSKKNSPGWRISLLLNMSGLGGVRIDFYYLPQVLRLTVFVLDRTIQHELLSEATFLIEQLQQYIESVHLEVLVSKAKIDHFEAEDWLDESGQYPPGLDVKA